MTNGNEPAHSFSVDENANVTFYGLDKREYFASQAMQGLLASPDYWKLAKGNPNYFSHKAVELADALISELNKPQP